MRMKILLYCLSLFIMSGGSIAVIVARVIRWRLLVVLCYDV